MKNTNKITNIFESIFVTLPFLSKNASRYEKLVWTARAIHILTKNDFKFNIEKPEDIDCLIQLLNNFFKNKGVEKLQLIESSDKRFGHYLSHNSLPEFIVKIKGLISNFIPYIELAVEYDSFKESNIYKNNFELLLSKKETENQPTFDLDIFQDINDDSIITNILKYVYKKRAEYYFKYKTIIKNNLITTQKIDVKNNSEFHELKLDFVKQCVDFKYLKETRNIVNLEADQVLETRLQRLTIKQLKSEHFGLQRKNFECYFNDVKNIFAKYNLLHPDFYEQNAFFFIKFLSGAKARYYNVHQQHIVQGSDFYDQTISFEVEVQPQILLIGSGEQGSGKSKFVEILFTNYIHKYICPSIDISRDAKYLNSSDSRQQGIFFKNQKGNLFTYLGDIKKFNMDVLKDVMDKKKVTYNIMRSDKSCTHDISLNFIMTMNSNFYSSGLIKRIQTSDFGGQRRLLFLISSEKNITENKYQQEKIKFDRLSQTTKFKDDMDYIMTHCPMGWDWMLDRLQEDKYIPIVTKYNEIQKNLQENQSPKKQHHEDLKELFCFFQIEYVPVQCLFQVFREKYNYRDTHHSFGNFLNDMGIEQKHIRGSTLQNIIPTKRIIFKGADYSLKEFIESCVNLNSIVRCRKNPFYDASQNKSEEIPF